MSSEPEKIQPSPRTRAYVRWVLRYGRVLWILALLLAVPAVWRTAHLYMTLRSDLESLLPPHAPSVVALEELRARTPGINTLGVVVDTVTADNLPAGEKFLDDLAARVRAYPPDLVNGVRTGIAEERKFVEDHAPLYAELADLETVRKRIEERRDYESAKAAEVDFDDEPPPPLDFSDIEKRYKEKQGASERFPNDRYSSAKEHASIMLVEIGGYSTGIARSQALLDRVRADVAALGGPEKYAPGMRIGFAGDPAISTEELSALEGDLTFSSLVVVGFVVLVLLAYYQWWKAVPVIVLPLLISVAYSFSIAGFAGVDYLNSNTAFLGSIIVGNGINFGIILVARYVEERRHGCPVEEAIAIAVHGTRVGTITAAAAAGIAYGSLLITQFRGFWQFGAIGGIGMLVCWGVTFVLIPPLLRWFDHSDALGPKLITPHGWSLTGQLARIVDRFPAPILGIALAVSLAAVVGSRSFGPERMETDFSKMRRSDTWQTGEGYWGRRMDAVLGRYLTPVVILTDNADQTRKIAAALREEAKTDPVLMQLVDSVRTVEDVLPSQQEAKLEQVKAVREIITPN
ncbi:MAG TPA: MMPL family transporter, partial [Polyangiaceae bacterium]|nr:MMPL family transporter [Polyangiaceae bacterium]